MKHVSRSARRGFTLLEALAVAAIFAIALSAATTGIGSAHEAAASRAFSAALRDLDARGRLAARTIGPIELRCDPNAQAVLAQLITTGEVLALVEIPPGAAAQFVDDRRHPVSAVRLDRAGRSIDFAMCIVTPGGEVLLHVAGLTGLIREVPR